MDLDAILDRCHRLEERAGVVYRSFAVSARPEPKLCALWTALAREEEEHARSIAVARSKLDAAAGWHTRVEGWEEAITQVEERLRHAEQLGPAATTTKRFAAALELELSELEALRHTLLAASREPDADAEAQDDHATRLADAAIAMSDDPQVRLQAALLRARVLLKGH
jgi:hypothetical protein